MTREQRLNEIRKQLIFDLLDAGLNTLQYGFAIDLTVTTLYEREKAYNDYLRAEKEGLKLSPYLARLQNWNTQARACLSMLKLTPTRNSRATATAAEDVDTIINL